MYIITIVVMLLSGSMILGNVLPLIGVINPFERTGIISGTVAPAESRAKIVAIQQGVPIDSSHADIGTGQFILGGLPQGLYEIRISARVDGYEEVTLTDINITPGITTDIGRIYLPELAAMNELN